MITAGNSMINKNKNNLALNSKMARMVNEINIISVKICWMPART
jgi:hypothetical protein